MIRADRRGVLKGTALATGALGFGPGARALGAGVDVVIHDRTLPGGGLAGLYPLARSIDLADERRTHWRRLRAGLGTAQRVEGLSGWSDWVAVRGELERQGFRVTTETKVTPRQFRWSMQK